jgi:hypothetical protein
VSTTKAALILTATLLPFAVAAADQPPAGAAGTNATPASGASDNASASKEAEAQASIPFANQGGIYDWRVVDDRTVLIQSINRQWYKATLFSPCIGLPFAQRIGFESNPDGSFDKFSAIKLRHQRCSLTSLVKTDPPTKKSKPHKPPEVTTAAPAAGPGTSPAPTPPPQ